MARLVSLAVLAALIVFLGITFYHVVAPFLLPLFLAGVLAILCQPLHRWFASRFKGRERLAAGATTFSVLAMVLIPLVVGTFIAAVQLTSLGREWLQSGRFNQSMRAIRAELQIDRLAERAEPLIGRRLTAQELEELQTEIRLNADAALKQVAARTFGFAGQALGFAGSLVAGVVGLVTFVIALYYFLADGPALIAGAERLIPVNVEYQRALMEQFDKVVRAVVVATFMAAIVQGVLTATALSWVMGFRHFFLLAIVATLVALVPLAGAWLVWGPCAVWLAYQNQWAAAIGLTLFGTVVIGTADNLVRTYVLHTDAKLHPLLAFISVLGGLHAMGLWGVFVGPIVASFLHALVKIFNMELQAFSMTRREAGTALVAQRKRAGRKPQPAAAAARAEDRLPGEHAPSPEASPPEPPAATAQAEPRTAPGTRGRRRRRRRRGRRGKQVDADQ